jgi:putative FmdB family regulatory protein
VPLYDYQCEAGHRYEKRESFGSPAQQPCEQCGKPAQRLLNAPPILFKGSGWYVTDSKRTLRTGVDSPTSSTDTAAEVSTSDDSSSSSESTTDSAPAKKSTSKPSAAKTTPKTTASKKKTSTNGTGSDA